jgi:N-acetylmuramic acid 6-phosphate etherase
MLDPRVTERRNPRTADIDLASPLEIVDLMTAEDRSVAEAVATQREPIARAVALIETAFREGHRLLYAGAGTSGRLGVLDASECPPTFGSDPALVRGIIAGGTAAMFRSQEGAEDAPEGGHADLEAEGLVAGDVVVGIAASGTTPYVRGALAYARAIGARTVLVACSPPPPELAETLDVLILPITGPEVVTGSTRLKAGTATKMVLNMLTTGAMIRVGKTYGNLMVDLQATNAKLRDRAERLLMVTCALSRDEARRALDAADGRVKVAIVMRQLGLDVATALARLDAAGGVVRRVLPGPPPPVSGA